MQSWCVNQRQKNGVGCACSGKRNKHWRSYSKVTVNVGERGDKDRHGVMDRKKAHVGPCLTRCDWEKALWGCKQHRIPAQLVNTLPCLAVPGSMAAPRSWCRRSSCIRYAMAISMEPPAMQSPVLVVIPFLGLHFRKELERPLRHCANLQMSAAQT
jgi:hypothetical protein